MTAEQKGKAKRQQIEDYLAFLDERMPKLMAEGYKGRTARRQADKEWAEQSKGQRQERASHDANRCPEASPRAAAGDF